MRNYDLKIWIDLKIEMSEIQLILDLYKSEDVNVHDIAYKLLSIAIKKNTCLQDFINNCIIHSVNGGHFVTHDKLYQVYKDWSKSECISSDELRKEMAKSHITNMYDQWICVMLKK
jgi:phage/plasmid-associated DNA primase